VFLEMLADGQIPARVVGAIHLRLLRPIHQDAARLVIKLLSAVHHLFTLESIRELACVCWGELAETYGPFRATMACGPDEAALLDLSVTLAGVLRGLDGATPLDDLAASDD